MPVDPEIESVIRRTAARHNIDPALMMAIAERESSFNPSAGSGSPKSSAYGLFKLLRGERARYGGSSTDPEEQADAWARYIKPTQAEMRSVLGRDPSGSETYLGHYFGGMRAAHMINGQIPEEMPVDHVFTPNEMAANPNFARAGTAGALRDSVLADVDRRQRKFGGGDQTGGAPSGTGRSGGVGLDFSSEAADAGPLDFSMEAEAA